MKTRLLHRQLSYRFSRLGWQGLAGLALLVAALAYAATAIPSDRQRNAQLNSQIAESITRLKKATEAPVSSQPASPAQQLQAFYREFPKGATVPDWLGKIYALANEQKLTLDAGEYTLTRIPSGRLDKFRITLPVKATYPQIRQFIASALSTAPALSLDGLYLKRDKVADGKVDARIVFLLHLESGT